MKKLFILLLILFVFISKTHAQDTLFFRNGSIKTGKITAIGLGKATYNVTDSDRTIAHNILSNKLKTIKYKSGKIDTIPDNENYANHFSIEIYNKEHKQTHLLDLSIIPIILFREINLKYEYDFKKINLGIFIPFSFESKERTIGQDRTSVDREFVKIKGTGIGVKVFLRPQSNHTFWFGIATLYDDVRVQTWAQIINGSGYPQYSNIDTEKAFQFSKFLQIGYQIYAANNIYLAANFNLGNSFVYRFHFQREIISGELKLGYKIK